MQIIKHVVLAFLVVASFPNSAHSQVVEEATVLRHKPVSNLNYLVERTLTCLKKYKNNETTTALHERAVVEYGKSTLDKRRGVLTRPIMTILGIDGNMKRYGVFRLHTLPPHAKKYPSGRLTTFATGDSAPGRPWTILEISGMVETFPMFPEKPTKPGQMWVVRMDVCPASNYKAIFPLKITHSFKGFETVEGRKCAIIDYKFEGSLETAKHPEMLVNPILKQIKPKHSLSGGGTVHFDLEAGIVVRKEHRIEWTRKWAGGQLDAKLAKRYPNSAADGKEVSSSQIAVKLISAKKASLLIKEAKEAEAARAKAAATKPVQPVVEKGPRWKYFVERTTTQRNNLAKKDKEKVFVDRAFVHYGAGAKRAGGQIKTVPQVVYVDKDKKRLPRAVYHGAAIIPFGSEKFNLINKLPQDAGSDPDFPFSVGGFQNAFWVLPLKPKDGLKEGLTWTCTLHTVPHLWVAKLMFPATIKHVVKGYERKRGRRCSVIKYTITGDFECADHPELFTKEQLREFKGVYHLMGSGTAYFDPIEGIIVEKEQTVSWTSLSEKLRRLKDGKIGWVRTQDQEDSVRIQVSLQPKNKFGSRGS